MTMESKYTLQDLVDLDRYPIDDLDGRGRNRLHKDALILATTPCATCPVSYAPRPKTVLEEIIYS